MLISSEAEGFSVLEWLYSWHWILFGSVGYEISSFKSGRRLLFEICSCWTSLFSMLNSTLCRVFQCLGMGVSWLYPFGSVDCEISRVKSGYISLFEICSCTVLFCMVDFFSEAESFSVRVLIVLLTLDPFGSIGICSCWATLLAMVDFSWARFHCCGIGFFLALDPFGPGHFAIYSVNEDVSYCCNALIPACYRGCLLGQTVLVFGVLIFSQHWNHLA